MKATFERAIGRVDPIGESCVMSGNDIGEYGSEIFDSLSAVLRSGGGVIDLLLNFA